MRKRGRRAAVHGCDVGDWRACEAMARAAGRELGPLDGVVANAGIYERRKVLELGPEVWERARCERT